MPLRPLRGSREATPLHLREAAAHGVLVSPQKINQYLPKAHCTHTCIERAYRAICPNYKQEDFPGKSMAINRMI